MSAQLDFTLYLGTEDQLPDPTIESYETAGTVPGFRGLAYIVFQRFRLERFGNRIPNFTFEIYSGTATECGMYSAGNLEPWAFQSDAGVLDPRNELNTHLYSSGFATPLVSLDEAQSDTETAIGRPVLVGALPGVGDSIYVHGWGSIGRRGRVASL